MWTTCTNLHLNQFIRFINMMFTSLVTDQTDVPKVNPRTWCLQWLVWPVGVITSIKKQFRLKHWDNQVLAEWTWHWPDEVSANGTECRLAKKRSHKLVAADLMYATLAGITSIAHCIGLLLKQLFFYRTWKYDQHTTSFTLVSTLQGAPKTDSQRSIANNLSTV